MNNKWKILAGILAAIVVAGVVYMGTQNTTNTVSSSSIAASETPVPTETPTPTDEPEAEETLEFDFDISVETYKVTQGVTEEELLADQAKKEGMFEWFYDGAVNYAQALMDKDNGCENVFLDEYIQWAGDKALAENPEAVPTPKPDTSDKNNSIYDENGNINWDNLPRDENGNIITSGVGSGMDQPENSMTDEEHDKMNEEFGESIKESIISGEAQDIIDQVNEMLKQDGYQP